MLIVRSFRGFIVVSFTLLLERYSRGPKETAYSEVLDVPDGVLSARLRRLRDSDDIPLPPSVQV